MEQKSFYSRIKIQSPSKSITTIPVIPALPAVPLQAIPRGSPNTILTNTCVVGSNGERTSHLMFYVRQGLIKGFRVVS